MESVDAEVYEAYERNELPFGSKDTLPSAPPTQRGKEATRFKHRWTQ